MVSTSTAASADLLHIQVEVMEVFLVIMKFSSTRPILMYCLSRKVMFSQHSFTFKVTFGPGHAGCVQSSINDHVEPHYVHLVHYVIQIQNVTFNLFCNKNYNL